MPEFPKSIRVRLLPGQFHQCDAVISHRICLFMLGVLLVDGVCEFRTSRGMRFDKWDYLCYITTNMMSSNYTSETKVCRDAEDV